MSASEPADSGAAPEPVILLDAYAARSCPVKTHNHYDRTVPRPDADANEALLELFAGGKAYETEVLKTLGRSAAAGMVTDLRDDTDAPIDWAAREEVTRAAVARGDALIIGAALPLDLSGHRRGQADLLVRGADRPDGRPGYLPVEVKRHRMLERNNNPLRTAAFGSLNAPLPASAVWLDSWTVRASRDLDLMQMAHYWCLLEAAGWSAGQAPSCGVIGTDVIPEINGPVISWVTLTDRFIRTFSRRAPDGWTLRSPLERYDHEHGFRVAVAQTALRRTGGPDDPRPMVAPIVIRECDHCVWWTSCEPQLDDEDLSLRISKSPLDVREISVLRAHGINTITDLADADVDALLESYLPEVRHRPGAEERLRLAARRASLMVAGVELERLTDDPLELPEAELEIDLDIETSSHDRVYLWGFLVHDRRPGASGKPYYKEFSRFCELDNLTEVALAAEALTWLEGLLNQCPDTRVYHYSDFELVHVDRLAARSRDDHLLAIAHRLRSVGVDLFEVVRRHFFGTNGLGLKVVANAGPGFGWRDEDPGGLNSQRWFSEACNDPDPAVRAEARVRVLEYNEDDVRATHALRRWMRGLEAAAQNADELAKD